MKRTYIVEGSNWNAKVLLENGEYGLDYKEAATRAMEAAFKENFLPNPDVTVTMTDNDPATVGLILGIHLEGETQDDDNAVWVRTVLIASNAGLPEIANVLLEAEKQIRGQ